jgi:hypothetical protein
MCSRSPLSVGPVRQSQGNPVPRWNIVVSHIRGLSDFLRRAASAAWSDLDFDLDRT